MNPEPLLTLREAAKAFGVKPHSLKVARETGKLKTVWLGRCYTRISWIEEMLQCHDEPPRPASTWTRAEKPGLSETVQISSALDSLRETTRALRGSSRATSRQSTPRQRLTTR